MSTGGSTSVQQTYAPSGRCFGCGPANALGLQLRSVPAPAPAEPGGGVPDELIAVFRPSAHHLAFDGIVNGGIIGTLLDCHSNWTAAIALMRRLGRPAPPCTVTADFHVTLKHPTPLEGPLELRAHPVQMTDDRVVVEATLEAGGRITATCRGTFVSVKPDHPAYHRW